MKTAISIPDDIFAAADELARQRGLSRSELYSRAVHEYVSKHAPDDVTDALDAALAACDTDSGFAQAAAQQVLRDSEW